MKNVDCRKLKADGLEELKNNVEGKKVSLRIIQVEGDSASDVYVRNKMKAGLEVGLDIQHILLDHNVPSSQILGLIDVFNNDNNVNGIMVQLPLPKHLDENLIINEINPEKDVDGLTTYNMGKIVSKEEGLRPCTAEGIMNILDKCVGLENLEGKDVTIIGRSKLVGLPLFHMLLEYNATPTLCHSKTKDLKSKTKDADIIVTAAGSKERIINSEMIKEGAIVIDVSTVKGEDGKLHGDVDYDDVIEKASYVTPVPGGVGQLTVLELMKNTYKAYTMQNNKTKEESKTYIKKVSR